MTVVNVHERVLAASIDRCAGLIDHLASERDQMWPADHWPAMRLAPRLTEGAAGGHGPIRYYVEEYEPGTRVQFRFTGPDGFVGRHGFRLEPCGPDRTRISHALTLSPRRSARLSWPLVFRHLHDALIEDALDRAEALMSGSRQPKSQPQWSRYVRFLRSLARSVGRTGTTGQRKT